MSRVAGRAIWDNYLRKSLEKRVVLIVDPSQFTTVHWELDRSLERIEVQEIYNDIRVTEILENYRAVRYSNPGGLHNSEVDFGGHSRSVEPRRTNLDVEIMIIVISDNKLLKGQFLQVYNLLELVGFKDTNRFNILNNSIKFAFMEDFLGGKITLTASSNFFNEKDSVKFMWDYYALCKRTATNTPFPKTISEAALDYYLESIKGKYNIYPPKSDTEWAFQKNAFRGGRVESFFLGVVEDIKCVDVNSMYGNFMRKLLPYKALTYRYALKDDYQDREYLKDNVYNMLKIINTKRNFEDYFIQVDRWMERLVEDDEYLGCIVKCDVSIPKELHLGPFMVRHGRGVTCPVGEFNTYLTTEEFLYGCEMGWVLGVEEVTYYAMDYIMRDYANEMLELRKNNKIYKSLINNLFGKFAQSNNSISRTKAQSHQLGRYMEEGDVVKDFSTDSTLVKVGGELYIENQNEVSRPAFSFPAISAHISGYSRLWMFKVLKDVVGEHNVFYIDTDGLKVNQEGYDNLKKAGLLDGGTGEVGLFKTEWEEAYSISIKGNKGYELVDKNGEVVHRAISGYGEIVEVKGEIVVGTRYEVQKDGSVKKVTSQLDYLKGVHNRSQSRDGQGVTYPFIREEFNRELYSTDIIKLEGFEFGREIGLDLI